MTPELARELDDLVNTFKERAEYYSKLATENYNTNHTFSCYCDGKSSGFYSASNSLAVVIREAYIITES